MPRRSWFALLGSAALMVSVAVGGTARPEARAAPIVEPPGGGAMTAGVVVGLGDLPPCATSGIRPVASSSASIDVAVQLDGQGSLAGWTLDLTQRVGSMVRISLPPESFVSREAHGRVVVTADDGRRSIVAVVATSDGCATIVAEVPDVVRSAVRRGPDGAVWYHAVDRITRRDLGVWKVPAPGAVPVPIAPSRGASEDGLDPIGRVFGTRLMLDTSERRLAIQACGERACRTRIVDLDDRREWRLDGPGQGLLESFDDRRAVFHGVCPDDPCPTQAVELFVAPDVAEVPALSPAPNPPGTERAR